MRSYDCVLHYIFERSRISLVFHLIAFRETAIDINVAAKKLHLTYRHGFRFAARAKRLIAYVPVDQPILDRRGV